MPGTYISPAETGFYYLNSRYYDPETGRFINADDTSMLGADGSTLGYNLFVYCKNNPINNSDTSGFLTISISASCNVVLLVGISFEVSLAFDDNGNIEWQYSYAIPGVNDTMMVGIFGFGATGAIQFTNASTVKDLYGKGISLGASGGAGWSIGADVISFDDITDADASMDGFQASVGVGGGIDVHIIKSYTRRVPNLLKLLKNQVLVHRKYKGMHTNMSK